MTERLNWVASYSALLAAIFAGLVAYPLLELLKSSISVRNERDRSRAALIVKLRILVGYLDAIDELIRRSFEPQRFWDVMDGLIPAGQVSWRALNSFDLGPLYKMIQELQNLETSQSGSSAAGQSLTKRLIIAIAAIEQVKILEITEGPKPNEVSINERDWLVPICARRSIHNIRKFIERVYSAKLGVDGMSFAHDKEIEEFDITLAKESGEQMLADARALLDK